MTVAALGRRLRSRREQLGLSVRAGAEACGLATSHLQRLEAGEVREPSAKTLGRIAAAYRLTRVELLRLAGYL